MSKFEKPYRKLKTPKDYPNRTLEEISEENTEKILKEVTKPYRPGVSSRVFSNIPLIVAAITGLFVFGFFRFTMQGVLSQPANPEDPADMRTIGEVYQLLRVMSHTIPYTAAISAFVLFRRALDGDY